MSESHFWLFVLMFMSLWVECLSHFWLFVLMFVSLWVECQSHFWLSVLTFCACVIVCGMSVKLLTFCCSYIMRHCEWHVNHTSDFLFTSLHPEVIMYGGWWDVKTYKLSLSPPFQHTHLRAHTHTHTEKQILVLMIPLNVTGRQNAAHVHHRLFI